jgi:hypothetical protein
VKVMLFISYLTIPAVRSVCCGHLSVIKVFVSTSHSIKGYAITDMLCRNKFRTQAQSLRFLDLEIIHKNLPDVIVAEEGCRSANYY